jgi:ribosomal protein L11 methyltransferase
MQSVIRAGDRVADLGSGSAVLAIAAAKLGATNVAAIELDHDAIENAEQNVAPIRSSGLPSSKATLRPCYRWSHRCESLRRTSLVGAHRASSGHRDDARRRWPRDPQQDSCGEREMMVRSIEDSGWRIEAEDQEDIWWSATIARR